MLEEEDTDNVAIGLRYGGQSSAINGFRLIAGTSRLTSGVMAGKPPTNIEEFFTKELPHHVKIDANNLKKAISRLRVFSADDSLFIKIDSNTQNIHLNTSNQSAGEAADVIIGSDNVGPTRTISVNATYVLDAIATSTKLLLENDQSAIRITHLDCPYNTQHVIGQMRQ